jgi:nucleoside-triphosphatase THEP1
MNSTLRRIVITGGSCAGKTTGLLRVQERLANLGLRHSMGFIAQT